MKQSLGILLIILALFLGYAGINKLDDSGETVKFLGITISAHDQEAKETGYILLAGAALCLIGGIMSMQGKKITV